LKEKGPGRERHGPLKRGLTRAERDPSNAEFYKGKALKDGGTGGEIPMETRRRKEDGRARLMARGF